MKKLLFLLFFLLLAGVVLADQSFYMMGVFQANQSTLGGPAPPTNYLVFTADRITFTADYLTFN